MKEVAGATALMLDASGILSLPESTYNKSLLARLAAVLARSILASAHLCTQLPGHTYACRQHSQPFP